jgi:hypothetical protein
MARFDERRKKKGRWTGHAPAGTVLALQSCERRSEVRCGVASRARAIIPAARALLVVAAPQK